MSLIPVCKALPTSAVDAPDAPVLEADLSPVELYERRPPTMRLTQVMKIRARMSEAPSSFARFGLRAVTTISSCL
jgi:hypothetical protein